MDDPNFNMYLRNVIRKMYVDNNIVAVNSLLGYNLSKQANEVIKPLIQLVMCTDYFKEETKIMLQGRTYSTSGRGNVNKNTIKSRIQYDLSKLKRELGAHALRNIITNDKMDLSSYKVTINRLLLENEKKSVLELLAIKVPVCNGNNIVNLEFEEWSQLLYLMEYYSKKTIQMMEKLFSTNYVGYIRHLELNENSLDEEERFKLNLLRSCVGIAK